MKHGSPAVCRVFIAAYVRLWPKAAPENTGFRVVGTSAIGKSGHYSWDSENRHSERPVSTQKRLLG
jgi:hypothetical protein